MARVTGIGGVFQRARDPKALEAWYAKHLGLKLADWGGSVFMWKDEVPAGTGSTTWGMFSESSKHLGAPSQRIMVNYRVDDLDALLESLSAAGAEVDAERQEHAYGKFGWFTDPEGNRVELWQPAEEESAEG